MHGRPLASLYLIAYPSLACNIPEVDVGVLFLLSLIKLITEIEFLLKQNSMGAVHGRPLASLCLIACHSLACDIPEMDFGVLFLLSLNKLITQTEFLFKPNCMGFYCT